MTRTQDELRQLFNSGTATDADMDEYINAGYDYNVLGPKSKAFYDQRKAVLQQNSSSSDTTTNANTSGTTANADIPDSNIQPDPEKLKKQLRKQYANDNEGYLKALKDNNIAVSNPSGKVRSIQEAYYDGGIDKSTRDYMMADAIAKFARNTGRDIGNIGAQFTGGTINNNYETPTWNDRNTELFKQKTSSEAAGIKGSDKNAQRRQQNANAYGTELSNEKNDKILEFSRKMKEMADDARKKGNKKLALALDYLSASTAGGNLSNTDLITTIGAELLNGGGGGEPGKDEEMAKAAQKVNEQALQNGKMTIGDIGKEQAKQQIIQGLDNLTKQVLDSELDDFFDNMYLYGSDKWTVDGAIEIAKQYAANKFMNLSPDAQNKIKSDAANKGWWNK